MERHRAAVGKIAAAVRGYFDKAEPYRIFHGSTNSTRPARGPNTRVVDISALSNVISADKARRTALVEPNVPMDALVDLHPQGGPRAPGGHGIPRHHRRRWLRRHGGRAAAFDMASSTIPSRSVEMVMADGEVVTATPEGARADLSEAPLAPWVPWASRPCWSCSC